MEYSEQFLNDNRDINLYDDWYTVVYEHATEWAMENYAFDVDKINFTGFWSQGDGASFVGGVNVAAWLLKHKLGNKYRRLLNAVKWRDAVITIDRISLRHWHENTCRLEDDDLEDTIICCPSEDKDELYEQAEKVVKIMEEERVRICKKIYRWLEEEYEYLTSDEAVAESLEANAIWEDGTIE